jgi:hypothetical protein
MCDSVSDMPGSSGRGGCSGGYGYYDSGDLGTTNSWDNYNGPTYSHNDGSNNYTRQNATNQKNCTGLHTNHVTCSISDVYGSKPPQENAEEEAAKTKTSEMLQCPDKPPNTYDKNWRSYEETGNPEIFHCGYNGFLEAMEKPPGSLTNECFYDEMDNLVDENHPHAACGGTPDEYPPDSLENKVKHTIIDKGGIVRSGVPAFVESREFELENLERSVWNELQNCENRTLNRVLPHDF